MNRTVSQKFRFYSFVCIALLLFVHGYNLNETYLQPFSQVKEPLTFTTFLEYIVSNALLRFRIPMLFIISGYIFALQDYQPYKQRIKKRFVTLMLPYFIWSAIGLAITFLWQQHPITAKAVLNAQLDQLGDNRPYLEMGWKDIIARWLFVPIAFQLWFIRSLFIYNVLYPVFKWLVMRHPAIWFSIMFILMLMMTQFYFIEAQGIFFFTAGIWLRKKNIALEKKPAWLSLYLCWLFFIGFSVIKTFMAFEFEEYQPITVIPMLILHYVSVIAGILAIWFSLDKVVKWFMTRRWFVWTTAFAFIIYGLHIPLLAYATRLSYLYTSHYAYYRLLTFIFVPLIILVFCVFTGAVLRKFVPSFYKLATGGRGI
jgi:fucose 4-O-acetylase-like acetyltransferase